ncbi:response regulator transcription factor [Consotaella salsifontis]|uniref:DNA-binding response regulator, OmpR family, contains REC and winged-helix (WHTH) domain n=1 Tax=Consotaella salsifontis TaxID=1365950 RepID=A0A1T4SM87_9HYPH|nr:response regulator transcription factor [Consotaella salsifontis]SKA29342.1 DNA-binding response regulator, OmpR family, contains REC and winged-helix (wHTH) domain [Consotaella salsifontis]
MRLLLVEDSPRLLQLLTETVHGAGWRIDGVSTLADARLALASSEHNILILDLSLPDGSGLDLLRELRQRGDTIPVLIITAADGVDSRIAGLDAGADDYLTKPFHHREFLARCRAIARRSASGALPVLSVGRLSYDPATSVVTCNGEVLALPPRERQLIELLMRDADRVVPKRKLEHALSEYGDMMSANALELAVSRLRKKIDLGAAGAVIETVRGVGYLLRTVG